MIGKVMKNASYRATTQYVLTKAGAEIIGGNMDGETVEALTREFMLSYSLHPDIERPVYHFPLSYSIADKATQDLSDERLSEIATRHLAGLIVSFRCYDLLKDENFEAFNQQIDAFIEEELGEYQFLVAIHRDKDHVHTHTIASRINLCTGKCIETWQDQLRSQKVIRELEKMYGLERVPSSWEVGRKARTKGQLEQQAVSTQDTAKAYAQAALDRLTTATPGLPITTLVEQLETAGIHAVVTYLSTGRARGISYEYEGVAMAGGKLGKRYTFPGGLMQLGVTYAAQRDDAALQARLTRAAAEPSPASPIESAPTVTANVPSLLESVLQAQAEAVARVAPLLEALWEGYGGQPGLTTLSLGPYRLERRAGPTPFTLYQGERALLVSTDQGYQGRGLSAKDCEALEQLRLALQPVVPPQPITPRPPQRLRTRKPPVQER